MKKSCPAGCLGPTGQKGRGALQSSAWHTEGRAGNEPLLVRGPILGLDRFLKRLIYLGHACTAHIQVVYRFWVPRRLGCCAGSKAEGGPLFTARSDRRALTENRETVPAYRLKAGNGTDLAAGHTSIPASAPRIPRLWDDTNRDYGRDAKASIRGKAHLLNRRVGRGQGHGRYGPSEIQSVLLSNTPKGMVRNYNY